MAMQWLQGAQKFCPWDSPGLHLCTDVITGPSFGLRCIPIWISYMLTPWNSSFPGVRSFRGITLFKEVTEPWYHPHLFFRQSFRIAAWGSHNPHFLLSHSASYALNYLNPDSEPEEHYRFREG